MTTEVKKEDIKASTTTTTTEEKKEDKEIKESETNLIQNKYEVAVKLQDLQADPNSPLFSVKSFEELGL
jgi:ATP-dependent RNA helicase DDX19/DBP5